VTGDTQLASATGGEYGLDIGLVMSMTNVSELACASSGAAGTSVCYDGVLA
jgi:hypothetical protein